MSEQEIMNKIRELETAHDLIKAQLLIEYTKINEIESIRGLLIKEGE